jgi:predicted acetyltransferase
LWSGGRSFDDYVADFRSLAASAFGKRRFRTIGLVVGGETVASLKRYQRELRCGERILRATGIGAVFTPEPQRGRGYATALLGALLDSERDAGADLAFLFSDIHPAFYERIGFIALPSRAITVRADGLPHARLAIRSLTDNDWPAVERCFTALDERRPFALTRPPLIWEWLRLRAQSRAADGTLVRLGLMRGRKLAAYVLGRRFASADALALDEFGALDDEAAALIPALLRNAAGDLRKITGWLPPHGARHAIPRGAVRTRRTGIAMIVPLSTAARAAWRRNASLVLGADGDPSWNADHI